MSSEAVKKILKDLPNIKWSSENKNLKSPNGSGLGGRPLVRIKMKDENTCEIRFVNVYYTIDPWFIHDGTPDPKWEECPTEEVSVYNTNEPWFN